MAHRFSIPIYGSARDMIAKAKKTDYSKISMKGESERPHAAFEMISKAVNVKNGIQAVNSRNAAFPNLGRSFCNARRGMKTEKRNFRGRFAIGNRTDYGSFGIIVAD